MTYEAKTTDLPSTSEGPVVMSRPMTPRRRRTIKAAEEKLDNELDLTPEEKEQAMRRIRGAAQPIREAQRIIDDRRSRTVENLGRYSNELDQSDFQEFVVMLIRRDRVIYPQHNTSLNRLARDIALGKLTPDQFRKRAANVYAIPSALPEKLRRAEARLLLG